MLTASQISALKPSEKPYKLIDARGLYLIVNPSGRHYWRFKYRFDGAEKSLALGVSPDVRLAAARKQRDVARHMIAEDGIDPSSKRSAEKYATADTFKAITEEWFSKGCPGKGSKGKPSSKTIDQLRARLEKYVYPWIGSKPIQKVTLDDMRLILDRLSRQGIHETANRVRALCDRIFRFAIATGRAERNFAADLADAVAVAKINHFSAITNPKEFGALLNAIDGYSGQPTTMLALKLAPMVFDRPGELRNAEWSAFDLKEKVWAISAEKMKMRLPHLVPLSKQSLAIIEELRLHTGNGRLLFPSLRSKERSISENTLNAALRRLDFGKDEMTAHGFRTSASTMLREMDYKHEWVEMQLAHKLGGVAGIYNRAEYLDQRTTMMQDWANYLDKIKTTK